MNTYLTSMLIGRVTVSLVVSFMVGNIVGMQAGSTVGMFVGAIFATVMLTGNILIHNVLLCVKED